MYTQNDGAWIKNVAEEARMVDAMRKGSDLTVKGISGRGTESTDQYSLKGLSAGARPRRAGVQVGLRVAAVSTVDGQPLASVQARGRGTTRWRGTAACLVLVRLIVRAETV